MPNAYGREITMTELGNQHFLLLPDTYDLFKDKSQPGRLNSLPYNPEFLRSKGRSLLKTLWKGRKCW